MQGRRRKLKYEDIYFSEYRTLAELKEGIKQYMSFCNGEQFHASYDYQTPDQMYEDKFLLAETDLCAVAEKQQEELSTIFSENIVLTTGPSFKGTTGGLPL